MKYVGGTLGRGCRPSVETHRPRSLNEGLSGLQHLFLVVFLLEGISHASTMIYYIIQYKNSPK